jgi:cytochrome P450
MSDPATHTGAVVALSLIGAIILSSSLFVLLFRPRTGDKRGTKIKKYPPYAPVSIYTIIKSRMNTRTDAYWMLDIARQLKSQIFQLRLPSAFPRKSLFIVGESHTSRQILLHSQTTKPDVPYKLLRLVFGGSPSMFTLDVGPEWHAKRKAVAPAFSSVHVKRMNRVALEKTEDWITKYNTSASTTGGGAVVVDVAHEMIGIVLSSICETAFEYKMSSVEQEYFTHELELALVEYVRKAATIPLRLRLGKYFISETRRAQLAVQNLIHMIHNIMKEYKARTTYIDGTIIQLIMQSHIAYPTEQEKAAELLTFLVAGHDTTGYRLVIFNVIHFPLF